MPCDYWLILAASLAKVWVFSCSEREPLPTVEALLLLVPGAQSQFLLQHVESSWTRMEPGVPCIGRWILYTGTTRKAFYSIFVGQKQLQPSNSYLRSSAEKIEINKHNPVHSREDLGVHEIIGLDYKNGITLMPKMTSLLPCGTKDILKRHVELKDILFHLQK